MSCSVILLQSRLSCPGCLIFSIFRSITFISNSKFNLWSIFKNLCLDSTLLASTFFLSCSILTNSRCSCSLVSTSSIHCSIVFISNSKFDFWRLYKILTFFSNSESNLWSLSRNLSLPFSTRPTLSTFSLSCLILATLALTCFLCCSISSRLSCPCSAPYLILSIPCSITFISDSKSNSDSNFSSFSKSSFLSSLIYFLIASTFSISCLIVSLAWIIFIIRLILS